jgi:hypothetical protein
MLAQMGGLAEEQLARAMTALSQRDTQLADLVIADDAKIDALEQGSRSARDHHRQAAADGERSARGDVGDQISPISRADRRSGQEPGEAHPCESDSLPRQIVTGPSG